MTHILFENQRIELSEGQTVLSALLERNHQIPNSCRAGVCQSCLMQAVEGDIPQAAQQGLKDTLKLQGYFMACSCVPETPLHIVAGKSEMLRYDATVTEHTIISENVLRLRLKPTQPFEYRAGQYITLWKNETLGRSYSLASVAALDDFLELHIRRLPDGQVSNWLHNEVSVADTLQIQAAIGDCFYVPEADTERDNKNDKTSTHESLPELSNQSFTKFPTKPTGGKILLAGTGTGLAPLLGIARDALHQGHRGDIHLTHGARHKGDLYMHQTLLDMAAQHKQFFYHTSVLETDPTLPAISSTPIDQQIINSQSDLSACKIYLCGDADMVNNLKRKLFIAGASMQKIYTDAFISSPG